MSIIEAIVDIVGPPAKLPGMLNDPRDMASVGLLESINGEVLKAAALKPLVQSGLLNRPDGLEHIESPFPLQDYAAVGIG